MKFDKMLKESSFGEVMGYAMLGLKISEFLKDGCILSKDGIEVTVEEIVELIENDCSNTTP